MNVLQVVHKEIADEIERLKDELCYGQPKDFAEYRYICGMLAGIHRIENIVDSLNKRLEEFDE